jgi:hypothetical protein
MMYLLGMGKWFLLLALVVLALVVGGALCWVNRAALAANRLEKGLKVPVKIASLNFGPGKATLANLWIGNPRRSKTATAFSAKTIEIDATLKEVRGNPLTVEQILIEDIFVGIEIYRGKESNWSHILTQRRKKAKSPRDYLIRKLIIRNLTVQLTKADGSVKTYPTIEEMEFNNISSETGFPIEEIEKAIFNKVMQEILRKFGLEQLNDTLEKVVPGGSPLKYIFKS